jgi:ribosome-binding ATPase YchF (GTP1/OBG family)
MLFADLEVVTSRAERLEASARKPRPDRESLLKELEVVKLVRDTLDKGKPVASLGLSTDDKRLLRSFGLLTDKPEVVVLNGVHGQGVPESLQSKVPAVLNVDAKLELELSELEPQERPAFLAELAIRELGRERIIRHAYDAVGIITFFTAGEPEVRGWNLERGASAVEAAGKIHTDLAKGFIRAEVTAFDDLRAAGSLKDAKAKHLMRLEGKDYIVKDGDVIYFRSAL